MTDLYRRASDRFERVIATAHASTLLDHIDPLDRLQILLAFWEARQPFWSASAIAAEIERARTAARAEFDHSRSVFFNDMLRRRNVTSPCQECEGYGVRAYPSTATWHRGAGGQMITSDVCDRCWGSGDAVKHGVDLRRLGAEIERARAEGRGDLDAELRRAVELRAQAVREAHSGALAGLEEAARLELEAAGLASYGDSPETTAREAHIFAVRCVKRAVAAEARLRESPAAPAPVARPISEWHEDRGSALWWRFPIEEPPYSGSPLDSDWPGYHTHWTPIVCPDEPHDQADADPASRGLIGGGS